MQVLGETRVLIAHKYNVKQFGSGNLFLAKVASEYYWYVIFLHKTLRVKKKKQGAKKPKRQEVHTFKIHSSSFTLLRPPAPSVLLYLPAAPLASLHP